MQRRIKVILADDQTMFREGLAEVLSHQGFRVIGQTAVGAECVELVRNMEPDVVVTQVELPLENTKQILADLLRISPPPKLVILTALEDPCVVRELMELGAGAYLVKSYSVQQLIWAIRAAVLSPSGAKAVVALPRQALERAEDPSEAVLSEREREILLLAARGLSNRQIAAMLHLSVTTVKRHLVNVYAKMGVGSRSEAVATALSKGWFTLRDVTGRTSS